MMKNRYILILIGVAFVSAFSVVATRAYLMKEVSNTNGYSIGNVKITLDESNVDELGVIIDETRVEDNNYHLMPGYTYVKDPTITLKKNSVDSYVRVLITVNKKDILKEIYGDNFKLENIYNGWGDNWSYIKETDGNNGETTYEYRYNLVVNGANGDNRLEPIFESFTIPKETTSEQLEKLKGLEVKIIAYGIQTEGFASADEAWESFDK